MIRQLAILLLVACALMLAVGAARAEKLSPDEIAALTIGRLQSQIATLKEQVLMCEVSRKYNLAEGDDIDLRSMEIARKPKPEAKAAAKPAVKK